MTLEIESLEAWQEQQLATETPAEADERDHDWTEDEQ